MPGLGANTTYSGGGSQIRTTGGTSLFGGGGPGRRGGGWLEDAARRRVNQQLRGGAIENQTRQFQLSEAQRASRQARAPRMETWDSQTGMDQAQRRHQMAMMQDERAQSAAQTRAMTGPAPMKMLFGPGIIPGRTLDPGAMSGAQRQMFLPGGSQMSQMDTPMEQGRRTYETARGQQRADMAGIQGLAQLMAGAQPGHMPPSLGGQYGSGGSGSAAPGGGGGQNWFRPGPWASPGTQTTRRYSQDRSPNRLFNPQYGAVT